MGSEAGSASAREPGRSTINIMDPALLVVDVQQGFDDAGYWGPRNNPACEDNIAALIAHARANDWPLVYVRHDSTEEHSPLRPDHPGNAFKHDHHRRARRPDLQAHQLVLLRRPRPPRWLQERNIEQLVLCGITTNHCCETTARMAGNLGYDVRFVLDATHTFDRGDLTADQLAHATATNLNEEFATIVTTASVTL